MKLTSCRIGKSSFNHMGWLIQFPYDALFLNDDFKDAIDAGYREWQPATKSWWISEECEPRMGELFENWAIAPVILKTSKLIKLGCLKCNNTGLIPFVKNGKVIPHAFVYCECQREEPEHYHRLRPDDFDFACSSAFRGYFTGLPDYRPPEPELPKEQVVIHRHSNMGAEERDLLQQTSLKADWLEKRLTELSKKRKDRL